MSQTLEQARIYNQKYCIKTQNAYWKERYQNDPTFREKARAACFKYYQKTKDNPEAKQYRAKYARRRQLQQIGIDEKILAESKIKQANKCAICGNIFINEKDCHPDHDHKTKQFRALLCKKCNLGLGLFKDDAEMLIKAADYLKSFKKK